MKSQLNPKRSGARGFALVVTLSLMILLTLIAVGLLSLSAVSLRNSSQVMAQAEAQANARLALMLALGDLQKSLGPDRAVTATSEIILPELPDPDKTKLNVTGVWESWWDFKPETAPDYTTEKTSRFRRWLVSSADLAALKSRDFVTTAWPKEEANKKPTTIELVGNGSLGASAPADAKVTAGLVPVSKSGKVQGSYGWHVSDESVKARINLYRDPGQNATLAQKRALLAGHRPDPSVLKSPDGSLLTCFPTDLNPGEFADATATTGKVIDLKQAELLDQAQGKIKPFRNDITPYSLGVLADVRGGGLKQDLSSIFEMGGTNSNTLPSEFNNRKLYQSTHGITGVSDPNWNVLAGYYNSFRNLTTPESNPTFAVKPPELLPDGTINPVPDDYNPAPVIAKVETIFSMVGRPKNDCHWGISEGKPIYDPYSHFVSLIYTPVVTLHNPYNVNISFHQMNVRFTNVPVAFQFVLNGVSQSVNPGTFESLNTMMLHQYRGDKSFLMKIANWSNSDPSNTSVNGLITMAPGQTLICGPTFPSGSSYYKDDRAHDKGTGFDWQNKLTDSIKAKPEFIAGLGFEIYSITFKNTLPASGFEWATFWMMLRPSDEFHVEFRPQRPSWYPQELFKTPPPWTVKEAAPSFLVEAELQATQNGTLEKYAKLQIDYQDDSTLKNVFNDRVHRYPPTGHLTASDVAAPSKVEYSEQGIYVHSFAIISAYARTTNGGVYETGQRTETSGASNLLQDGRLAGKPFLFHNPAKMDFKLNLAKEKPAVQAYELNFQPLESQTDLEDFFFPIDAINRVPALSGNKTTTGVKSGSYLELPSGPLQTIADFRRSNALTTSYPPHFVQPVGNSLLHPLMSADKVVESNSSIPGADMLDHSVLANNALYDRFYFSTFATRGSETPDAVFEQFMNGTRPLASQSFQPYQPSGKSIADSKAELFASSGKPKDGAYKTAAEYQMIRGPFNINSTSVQAWKAVLAAMNKSEVTTLWALTAGLETRNASGVPITSMSLPNGGGIPGSALDASKIDNERTNNWNGYRELTEAELENLAEKIVEQVRERGPFLSMSEFVNRQVGPSGERTLKGALEAAIVKAEINEEQNATSADSFLNQVPITIANVSDPKLYNYKTPEATTGNPAAGAPGWVNQGDLLRILEPGATVRGDTFVIRTYGEAQDASGNITARAYAEAVVQRVPEYIDPADRPSLNASVDPTAKAANKTFGRRINVLSFRWLSGNEI